MYNKNYYRVQIADLQVEQEGDWVQVVTHSAYLTDLEFLGGYCLVMAVGGLGAVGEVGVQYQVACLQV